MDSICALPNRPHIDAEIQEKERMLAAIHEHEDVLTKPYFGEINLPAFDIVTIEDILQKGLPDLDAEAANRVSGHLAELGEGGEKWISDGIELLPPPGSDGTLSLLRSESRRLILNTPLPRILQSSLQQPETKDYSSTCRSQCYM